MTAQLALFQPPAPEKPYGQTQREKMHALAISPEVIEDLLTVFRAHRGEYISFHQKCRAVFHRYNLGSYCNLALHHMEHLGMIEPKRIYLGAESPVDATPATKKRGKQAELEKPYLGYQELYRLKESD